MTEGPFTKKIIAFALPLLFTQLLQVFYNAADMIVLGRFAGTLPLAAVGATTQLITLIINLFVGTSSGVGVVSGIMIGAKDEKGLEKTIYSGLSIGLVCGVAVGITGVLMSHTFMVWMGTPSDVLDMSALYLRIYFLGAPANILFNFTAASVRATGDTKHPMYILTFTGLLNVILNIVMVAALHLEVAGVAIATVISQYASVVLVLMWLKKMDLPFKVELKNIGFSRKETAQILKVGLPTGLQLCMYNISNVLIQSNLNLFGSTVVAGYTAGANIDNIIFISGNAISQAAMNFTGHNVGARRADNIKKVYRISLLLNFTYASIFAVAVYIFRVPVLSLFSSDPEVIAVGAGRMLFLTLPLPICNMQDTAGNTLSGLEKSVYAMVITMIGTTFVRFAWIFLAFKPHQMLQILYLAYPISWVITFSSLNLCVILFQKKLEKQFERTE